MSHDKLIYFPIKILIFSIADFKHTKTMLNISSNTSPPFADLTCLYLHTYAINIIGIYLIPTISLLGLLLNSFLAYMLCDKRLKSRCYKYILCKAVIDLLISIFGIASGPGNCLCPTCNEVDTYWLIFYRIYLVAVPIRILFLTSALSEIYISLNRRYTLENIKNVFTTMSLRMYILIILLAPCLLAVPFFCLTYIDKAHHGPVGYSIQTVSKLYFGLYWLFNSLLDTVMPTGMLIAANVQVMAKYRERMEIKRRTVVRLDGERAFKRSERRFTLVVIVNSGLLAGVRSLDLVTGVMVKLQLTGNVLGIHDSSLCILEVFLMVTNLLLFATAGFSAFIYIAIDKNLKRLLMTYLRMVRIKADLSVGGLLYRFFRYFLKRKVVPEGGMESRSLTVHPKKTLDLNSVGSFPVKQEDYEIQVESCMI